QPLYIASMLRELPFKTIGDVAVHGLHVYFPSCHSTRRLVDLERWADRCFATARFRCTGARHNGVPCGASACRSSSRPNWCVRGLRGHGHTVRSLIRELSKAPESDETR